MCIKIMNFRSFDYFYFLNQNAITTLHFLEMCKQKQKLGLDHYTDPFLQLK